MVQLNRGGKAAEQKSKEQAAARYARINYITAELKNDNDAVIVRFIDDDDDWIYVNQHAFVETKEAPDDTADDAKKNWPTRMGAVCRYDSCFQGEYTDCYICDHMINERGKPHNPSLRLWARVVEREAVVGTEQMAAEKAIPPHMVGKRVGFRDVEIDQPVLDDKGEPTGEKVRRKKIMVVNMGLKNFFSQLQGYADVHGTVLDRDYHITRSNGKTPTDVDYKIISMDPTPNHDLRNPEIRERYEQAAKDSGIDLQEMIVERASDDYYAKFFDPTREPASKDSSTPATPNAAPPAQQAKPADKPNAAAIAAMRERVIGKNPPKQTEGSAVETSASPINFG